MQGRFFPLLFVFAVLLCALAVQAQTSDPQVALPEAPNLTAADVPAPPEVSHLHGATYARPLLVTALWAPPRPKVIDKKFIALTALTFGLTSLDVEMTHHCLKAGTCYEMNPTLPNSRAGQYAINTLTNVAVTYFSYRRRKSGKWGWWVAPVIDMGAHGVGIGTNIRFLGK
jgi:hypothetical protein